MEIIEHDTLDRLVKDVAALPRRHRKDMISVVRDNIVTGNRLARDSARVSSGRHGKLYPRSFSSEMKLYGALGLIAGEYGPDSAKRQGGMEFEEGSRNQKPHRDLAKSADIIGPEFADDVHHVVGTWFW